MTGCGRALLGMILAWASAGPGTAPELSGTGWVNAQNLDLERFRGKVVLLYFFEESCLNCRASVSMRNDLARKYADKPSVFIAVNSGNPRSAVEEYAKSTKFEWPILVDELRETEAKYGRKISLSNVYWFFVVAPDGTYQEFGADVGRAEKHIQELLPKTRMLFEGIKVPPQLRPVGRRLEAGQRGESVQELYRITQGEKGETSEAARQMFERLQAQGDARLKRAGELKEKEDRVGAFDAFSDLERDFPGTPLAREAQKEAEGLRQDKDVRAELQARGLLDQARAVQGKGKPGRAQARAILEGLIRSFPKTPSAEVARRLLKLLEETGKK